MLLRRALLQWRCPTSARRSSRTASLAATRLARAVQLPSTQVCSWCHTMATCHTMLAMSCHATLCPTYVMLFCAVPCHVHSCKTCMPCHVAACHAMPCHAMPCHSHPRHAMHVPLLPAGSSANFTRCEFVENSAQNVGGAISVGGGVSSVMQCSFIGNSAGGPWCCCCCCCC